MEKFDHYLDVFEKFCIDVEIPAPVYRQFELVYVNHISKSNGLNLVSPDSIFVDHTRLTLENRFLPSPSLINWITSYALPDDSGRLHISMQSAFSNHPVSEEVVRMDLTARGIPKVSTENSKRMWFDMAHEWITRGFADSTSEVLHKNNCWDKTS